MPQHGRFFGMRKKRPAWKYILGALALLLIALLGSAGLDNNRVVVAEESVVVGGLSRAMEGFTILHISDLHGKQFGQEQVNLINAISKLKFDAVAITGNMAGDDPMAAYQLMFALNQANVPVFFITGSHDPAALSTEPGNETLSGYVTDMEKRGGIYLDAPRRVQVGDRAIWFVPEHQISLDIEATRSNLVGQRENIEGRYASDPERYGVELRNVEYQLDVLDRLEEARASFQNDDVFIALMRHPMTEDFVSTMQEWSGGESDEESGGEDGTFLRKLHLVLTGYYNGGQVRLPFLGAVYIPAKHLPMGGWLPDQSQVSGMMTVSGISQYTSPGLGVSPDYAIPMRILNTPTITLLKLTSQV